MLRVSPLIGASALAFAEDFENFGATQTVNGYTPIGWQNGSGYDGAAGDYAKTNRSTLRPFNGASSLALYRPGNSARASISRVMDTRGFARMKFRVAGTNQNNAYYNHVCVAFGKQFGAGAADTAISIINTGVPAPYGTWWEFIYAGTGKVNDAISIGMATSSEDQNVYIDGLVIY